MKALIVSIILTLTVSSLTAQKWYVGVRGGFGFPIQKDVVAQSGLGAFGVGNDDSYIKDYEASFGKGIYATVFTGREIDSLSFFEVELRYWKSNSVNTIWQGHNLIVGAPPYYVSRRNITTNNIFVNFSYGIKYPIKPKFDVYSKIGVMVGQNFAREKEVTHNHGYYSRTEFELISNYKYNANFTIGFTGSLGLTYSFAKRWKLNSEVFVQLAGARMLSRELTNYTADGKDIMSEVPPEKRKVDFYYPKNKTIYDNAEAAGKLVPQTSPLSSLGISLGLIYDL